MMFPTGFHVEFDVSKPPGSRVRSISILCTKCRVPHYEPLEDEMVYTVVIPSYMVGGGDGYSIIRDEAIKHNSGEMFGCKEGFLVLCCGAKTRPFIFLLVSLQDIWTSQSCPTTSCKGSKFIRLLKDASRSTTRLLHWAGNLLRWFYWFHWCCSGLFVGASKTDFTQKHVRTEGGLHVENWCSDGCTAL